MRCLNCYHDNIPAGTEHCPRCKFHLPSLLQDTLASGSCLRSETYCIEHAIGRGSFGITYQARHRVLNEVFAIKEFYPTEYVLRNQCNQNVLVPTEKKNSFQRSRYRFIEEAKILAKINHPNVVRVYDMFEEYGTAYMVMDLIQGKTLTRILKTHPGHKLPLPRVEAIVQQLVEALGALHRGGIYHLDIKPENILLTPDNQVRLIDFGAARQVTNARSLDTRLFTESYAPPELMTGGEIGAESDLFELGMMTHQLITGHLPPPAMKRLVDPNPWEPDGLIAPWTELITLALQLKRDQRPPTLQDWWKIGENCLVPSPNQHSGNPDLTHLWGNFVHPDLAQDRLEHRFGRGCLRTVVGLSPTLVLAIAAGGAALFDLQSQQALWEIDTPVHQGLLSPDGQFLIVAYRRWIYVWHLSTGRFIQQFQGHPHSIHRLACTQENQIICSSQKSDIVLVWEAKTGEQRRSLQTRHPLMLEMGLSLDGHYLATGHQDGLVCLWDQRQGQELCSLQGHQDAIECLTFSPQGDVLASGSRDNTIQLWSIPSGQPLQRLKGHIDWVKTIVFSPDGAYLASSAGMNDKAIRLWQVVTGKEFGRLRGHWNRVHCLSFCPDGHHLVSGSFDNTLRLWDLEAGREMQQLQGHSNWVYALAANPGGQRLATGTNHGEICLWGQDNGTEPLARFFGHGDAVTAIAFSPDGRFLLSGGQDKNLRLWDIAEATVVRTFADHRDWISAVAISADQHHIASASWDSLIRLWDWSDRWQRLRGGKPQRTLVGHHDHVTAIAFSHDSRLLVSGSKDQTLRLWEVVSGQEVKQFIGHKHHVRCVAFSPDDQFIASGSWDKSVRLWHVSSGAELKPSLQHNDYIQAIAYSEDGQYLASGGRSGVIHLWNLVTGKEAKRIKAHTNTINCLTFDHNDLISADQDGVVRSWKV